MKRIENFFLLVVLALFALVQPAAAQNPVARAILFYSPSCPHCHVVMTEGLPPLIDEYNSQVELTYLPTDTPLQRDELPPLIGILGNKLQLIYINTGTPIGSEFYFAAVDHFSIPEERLGVPALIVGETVLVGSIEIPDQFPSIIEHGLAQDGIDWPEIPGLEEALARMIPVPTDESTPEGTPHSTEETATGDPLETLPAPSTPPAPVATSTFDFDQLKPTVIDKIKNDLAGNIISIAVLIGLIITVVIVGRKIFQQPANHSLRKVHLAIPLLAVLGIIVAGYLAYVETTGTEAVCGPVGDCNTVQQSKYAMLFGVIPVAALGVFGYIAILAAWLFTQPEDGLLSDLATMAIFGMTTFGALFSIYLTFLEPFVIGASCAWCLTSAVIITVQMWLATDPAMAALARLQERQGR